MNIYRYISMEELGRGGWSGVQPHERHEARQRLLAALAAEPQSESAPEPRAETGEDRWLTVERVEASYPTLTRDWLFKNADRYSWIKRTSPRKLLINESGLQRWLLR
jgi:hypothetical protein